MVCSDLHLCFRTISGEATEADVQFRHGRHSLCLYAVRYHSGRVYAHRSGPGIRPTIVCRKTELTGNLGSSEFATNSIPTGTRRVSQTPEGPNSVLIMVGG